jgi:hypothetical protein
MNAANTSVMMAGGELWALWEGGSPTRSTRTHWRHAGIRPFRERPRRTCRFRAPEGRAEWPHLEYRRQRSRGIIWRLPRTARSKMRK